jgi:hypothetical protein
MVLDLQPAGHGHDQILQGILVRRWIPDLTAKDDTEYSIPLHDVKASGILSGRPESLVANPGHLGRSSGGVIGKHLGKLGLHLLPGCLG